MAETGSALSRAFRRNVRQSAMVLSLLGIWAVFALATDGVFLAPRNLSNLFLQTVAVGIAAAGMALVIVAGQIDLSVGSVAGFAGAVAAVLQVSHGWPTAPAIAAGILAGAAVGAWHGFWVAYRRVPAFVVTLASMLAFRGLILGITGGQTVSPLHDSFKGIGQRYLPRLTGGTGPHDTTLLLGLVAIVLFALLAARRRSQRLRYGFEVLPAGLEALKVAGIALALSAFFAVLAANQGMPVAVLLLALVVVALDFVARHTVFGRHLYAAGAGPEAARLSGIDVKKRVFQLFALFGALTGLSGIVLTARLNAATTSAGVNMELDAIAAAVIGGTSLMGGEGTVAGAVVGALIMASLDNGMSLLNLDVTFQYVVKGLVLLLAVWVDMATRKRG